MKTSPDGPEACGRAHAERDFPVQKRSMGRTHAGVVCSEGVQLSLEKLGGMAVFSLSFIAHYKTKHTHSPSLSLSSGCSGLEFSAGHPPPHSHVHISRCSEP